MQNAKFSPRRCEGSRSKHANSIHLPYYFSQQLSTIKYMNRIVAILTIHFLLNGCTFERSENIVACVSIIEKLTATSLKVDKGIFYSIKTELTNNTDTVFSYWTMSCSWESNWVFEDKGMNFFVECNANVPVLKQILPGDSIISQGIVEVVDTTYLKGNSDIKIGFVLVRKYEAFALSDFHKISRNKIRERKDIIWSKPFKINK